MRLPQTATSTITREAETRNYSSTAMLLNVEDEELARIGEIMITGRYGVQRILTERVVLNNGVVNRE